MDRFKAGLCVAALLWFTWVGVALYVSATRALPDIPIHYAAAPADDWCDFKPAPPMVGTPKHNYDIRNGRRVGSIA
jgi:hypothetical protein